MKTCHSNLGLGLAYTCRKSRLDTCLWDSTWDLSTALLCNPSIFSLTFLSISGRFNFGCQQWQADINACPTMTSRYQSLPNNDEQISMPAQQWRADINACPTMTSRYQSLPNNDEQISIPAQQWWADINACPTMTSRYQSLPNNDKQISMQCLPNNDE